MSVLVIGGSQGARALSDTVPPAIAGLPAEVLGNLRISHQARKEDAERVVAAYAEHGSPAEVEPFFPDVPRRISEAQLVISRAGASSVADIGVIGRPAILVPYPFAAADHQSANARGLAQAGAAIVIPESRLDVQTLTEQIAAVLTDPQGAARMAQAALDAAMPQAHETLADIVEELAQKGRKR